MDGAHPSAAAAAARRGTERAPGPAPAPATSGHPVSATDRPVHACCARGARWRKVSAQPTKTADLLWLRRVHRAWPRLRPASGGASRRAACLAGRGRLAGRRRLGGEAPAPRHRGDIAPRRRGGGIAGAACGRREAVEGLRHRPPPYLSAPRGTGRVAVGPQPADTGARATHRQTLEPKAPLRALNSGQGW
jgi:hypothetical protein